MCFVSARTGASSDAPELHIGGDRAAAANRPRSSPPQFYKGERRQAEGTAPTQAPAKRVMPVFKVTVDPCVGRMGITASTGHW